MASDVIEARPGELTLEGLFRAYADDVCRLVARLLGPGAPAADVDDVAQQAFIAMHKALPRFRGDSTPRTWVLGVTAKVVLQHLRSRRRYRAMIDRFDSDRTVFAPSYTDGEAEALKRDAVRRVWGALLRVKAERRVAFVLCELEGWSHREAGEALSLSEEAVRSRLRRARSDLQKHLSSEALS